MDFEARISSCVRLGRQAAESVDENFLNPLVNAAIVEPLDTVASAAGRLCGQTKTKDLIHKLKETPCQDYSLAFWTQNIARGLGSVIPYAIAGRFGGGALRAVGSAAKLSGVAERFVTSEQAAQVMGAMAYESLKEVQPGQTAAGNIAATGGSFAVYEAGNFLSRDLSLPSRFAARLATGFTGSTLQFGVSHAGELLSGTGLKDDKSKQNMWRSFSTTVVSGTVMNAVLPETQEAMRHLEDRGNLALGLGVPGERHLTTNYSKGQLAALSPELKELMEKYPWMRVQTGARETSYSIKRDLIRIKKDATNLPDLLHEMKHREEALSKVAEPGFKLAAKHLESGDESKSWQTYRAVRMAQETRARLAEDRATKALDPAFVTRDARAIKAAVPDSIATDGKTYEQLWREEFEQFKQSNGGFRPRIDFNEEETERVLGKQRSKLIKLSGNNKADWQQIMKDVEDRSDLSRSDIAVIYRDLGRMVSGKDKAPPELKPVKLALDVLTHVADPYESVQGSHPTCGPAGFGFVYYVNYPRTAVSLISQAARHGFFTTADDTRINLSDLSLKDERLWNRSHADQIFQTAIVNAYWQRQPRFLSGLDDCTVLSVLGYKGFLRYERQITNNLMQSPYRLMDFSKTPPRPVTQLDFDIPQYDPADPHITSDALQDVHRQLAGYDARNIIAPDFFNSPESLAKVLNNARNARELPLMLTVDTRNPPFDSRHRGADAGGRHAIVATGYNPKSGFVSIFNPWGHNYLQEGLTIPELWRATLRYKEKPQPTKDEIYKLIGEFNGIDDEHV